MSDQWSDRRERDNNNDRIRRRSRSRSQDRSRHDERRRSRSRDRDDRRGDRYGDERRRRDHRDDRGNGGMSSAPPAPRLDWLCIQCQAQNFARRVQCFKCSSARTEACPVIRGGDLAMPGGGGGGPSLDDLVCASGQTSSTVLVKHLSPDVTVAAIAEAFRVYAQVKEVQLVFDPRPGASRNPAALIDFHTAEMALHVVAATSKSDSELLIAKRVSSKPQLAKQAASLMVEGWQHRAAQEAQQAALLLEQQRILMSYRTNGGGGGGGDSGGPLEGTRHRNGGGGDDDHHNRRDRRDLPAVLVAKKVPPPLWPPSFEEDGMAWVFDAASGYFLHRPTEMFFEPKAKYYAKVVLGKYEYFHHAPGMTPPFVPMVTGHTEQQQPAAQPAQPLQQPRGALAGGGAQTVPLVASTPAVPTAAHAAAAVAATAVAEVAAARTSALAAAAAQQKEEKRQAKQALSAAKKKNHKDMDKWKSVQQTADIETSGASSSSAAVPPPQQQMHQSRAVPTIAGGGGGLFGGGGGVGVAPLLALGTDYTSIGKLRLLPEGVSGGAEGKPLAEGSGGKWSCLVSRRAFSSEEQLAKHVRVSKLYREELTKAIEEGRVVMLP